MNFPTFFILQFQWKIRHFAVFRGSFHVRRDVFEIEGKFYELVSSFREIT